MRVAVAGMYHETNTFAYEHNDKLDAKLLVGQEIIEQSHPRNFIGGFLEGAAKHGIEPVPAVDVRFSHGGLIHADVFEHYRDMIVDALAKAGPLDAVYFALHGAAAAEDPYTDLEGNLMAAARKAVGDIPFVATYDFHAIMSKEEVALLSGAFPNDTNPHIDGYERGLEAADCVAGILRGEIRPVTRVVHIPIVGPNIGQSTWSHIPEDEQALPLYQLNLLREELEQTPGIINITIMGGYGYADTPDSSMSVLVTADGDVELADRIGRQLAREVWAKREDILNVRPIVDIDTGVREAMSRSETPVMLVDLGDDPGSATAADGPAVLESLIRLGAKDVVMTIRDPNVVEAGLKAGVGATLDMEVGAAIEERFYRPIRVQGKVKLIDDGEYVICGPTHGGWGREVLREARREAHFGPRVVLRIGDKIDVIFTKDRTGKDRDFFKSAGTVFDEKQIIVVKSNQAHRASFDPIVASTIDLATPGASTVDYSSLPFRHLPRPIWPVDRDFDWSPDED